MTHWNVSLLRAIGVAAAVVINALIGSGFLFVATHRSSSAESVETADTEFQQLRARFINQRALLDMNQRQARIDAAGAKHPAPLHTFHTVIFDTRGGQRLVHMTVPYWWARRYGQHGEIKHTSGSALDAVQAARVERIGVSVSPWLVRIQSSA
ncbi:MAG: hypothetical protein DMF95_20180 [Acidobacteria bacterium]|nr:MAG: hypothetical protein DMF95_20180 [Acidobacteriota bacterium]